MRLMAICLKDVVYIPLRY